MASTDDDDRAIDHEAELEEFITKLSENPQVEQIVSEIGGARILWQIIPRSILSMTILTSPTHP